MPQLLLAMRAAPWVAILGLLIALGISRGQTRKWHDQSDKCAAARQLDRATYEQAQRQAAEQNKAEVKRIESEQEKISADQKSRYERDLARVRAGGVRQDLAAPPGSPGKPGAPGVPETTCRADATNVCISRSDALRAAEIELARNALIDWLERQLGIAR